MDQSDGLLEFLPSEPSPWGCAQLPLDKVWCETSRCSDSRLNLVEHVVEPPLDLLGGRFLEFIVEHSDLGDRGV